MKVSTANKIAAVNSSKSGGYANGCNNRFDEILWGAKFLPAFSVTEGGDMALELNQPSEVVEAAV